MTKEQENLNDVKFIYEAVEAFHGRPHDEIRAHFQDNHNDVFTTLTLRSGGTFFCGKAAYARFDAIAKRKLKRGSDAERDFAFRDYVEAIRTAFAETFIEQAKPIDQRSVSKFLSLADRLAAERLVERTYHLSCELFKEETPDTFKCGPVNFTTTKRFLSERQSEIDSYVQESHDAFAKGLRKRSPTLSPADVERDAERFASTHSERIRAYYSGNDWVASVSIASSHPSISRERAERVIDAAMDVLRLFAVYAPERIRRSSIVPQSETYELITERHGSVTARMYVSGRNAVAGDGWYDALQARAANIWRRLEEAITPICDGNIRDELDQRLVDALNWFGQAVRETNRAAAVVKYAAALERLTVTGHVENVERVVTRRTLILNQSRLDKSEEQIQREIGQFYQCRSDLMHGSLSPFHPSVEPILRFARELTRWSILEAARLFHLLRQNGHPTRKALATAYQGGKKWDDGSLLSGA
jgi:hypothetical protein